MIKLIADCAVPTVAAIILLAGWLSGVDVFEEFLAGAKSGIKTSFDILPALAALMTAVGVFSASGALDMITASLSPAARLLALPSEVLPLALLRPISGSASLAVLQNLLTQYGADSFVGRGASVMNGAAETTFYTVAVYFGAISVKKSRHTVCASLAADAAVFITSALFVRLMFS